MGQYSVSGNNCGHQVLAGPVAYHVLESAKRLAKQREQNKDTQPTKQSEVGAESLNNRRTRAMTTLKLVPEPPTGNETLEEQLFEDGSGHSIDWKRGIYTIWEAKPPYSVQQSGTTLKNEQAPNSSDSKPEAPDSLLKPL